MKIFLLFLFLIPLCCFGQESGNVDLGIGAQSNTTFVVSGSVGLGSTVFKELYCFGGAKLCRNNLIPDRIVEEHVDWDYNEVTTNVWNFNFYLGSRYSFTLRNYGKLANIERFGFFPEVRVYFNPHVPNKLSYWDLNGETVNLKGEYATQIAYGLGGGFFIGTIEEGYFAIKYEISTIDPFAVIRTLDYPKDRFSFTKSVQHLISISLYFR